MNITTITADDNLADQIRAWLLRIAIKNIDIEKVIGFALAKFENTTDDFKAYAMRPYETKTGVKEVLVLK